MSRRRHASQPKSRSDAIAAGLRANYDLEATSITFLPIGYDLNAWVYEVSADGRSSFPKIRAGPPNEPSVLVPRALLERGVPLILARAEELGKQLQVQVQVQATSFEHVLCHADIHGANILVGEEAESLAWGFFAPGGMLGGVEPVSLVRVTGEGVMM